MPVIILVHLVSSIIVYGNQDIFPSGHDHKKDENTGSTSYTPKTRPFYARFYQATGILFLIIIVLLILFYAF